MKSTKRSLLLSTLSLILCVAMLLGTTYAWFTDNVTSGKNKIISGNLDVELTHTNAKVTDQKVQDATDLFGVALWEPGVIAWENFTVTNAGNLALKYALNLNVFDKNATTEGHDLAEVIKVAVIDDGFTATGDPVADRASAQNIEGGFKTLEDFQKTGNLKAKGTSGEDSDTYGVVLYWEPTDSDNLYNLKNGLESDDGQPLFIEFGVNLVATQDTVEADSFDNKYDKTAPLAVSSKPITEKLANTESLKIIVPEDAKSSVKEATVPAAVANAVFDKVFEGSSATDKSLTLVLSVEEKSKTDTTFNYEIDMDAVIKEMNGSTVTKSETKSVNELGLNFTDFVEVQMNIAPGLSNVKVKHNGKDMTEVADKAEAIAHTPENINGYFNYTKSNGNLLLWTKTFSPFTVTGEKVIEFPAVGKTVPANCKYTCSSGTVYNAGETIPAEYDPVDGDTFIDADYTYKFNRVRAGIFWTDNGYKFDGWSALANDKSKTSYDLPMESINGKPVNKFFHTYENCTALTAIPAIPKCTVIFDSTFKNCTSLVSAPAIPSNVTNVFEAFSGCTSLKGSIKVDAVLALQEDKNDYNNFLLNCAKDADHKIILTGSCTALKTLKSTGYNNGEFVEIK